MCFSFRHNKDEIETVADKVRHFNFFMNMILLATQETTTDGLGQTKKTSISNWWYAINDHVKSYIRYLICFFSGAAAVRKEIEDET
ncbi:hypothetical protein Tco_0837884 [Tanacetum coccineum]